jgi:hypothetical protein
MMRRISLPVCPLASCLEGSATAALNGCPRVMEVGRANGTVVAGIPSASSFFL